VPDSFDFFDKEVDCVGGSVGDPAGGEVGQQFAAPGVDGGGQPDEFGDGGVGQPPVQGLLGAGAGAVGAVADQSQVLSGDPGAGKLFIGGIAGSQPSEQSCPGARGVVVGGAAQQSADAVERVAGAAAVAGLLLLDAAADLIDGGEPEPHDVESVEHPHCGAQHTVGCPAFSG
jgi:hypothetical protein